VPPLLAVCTFPYTYAYGVGFLVSLFAPPYIDMVLDICWLDGAWSSAWKELLVMEVRGVGGGVRCAGNAFANCLACYHLEGM
jgi:hypothetical protein